MSSNHQTKQWRANKRGAFINGIWHCDCDPRKPAEKFQTKNGGKNHGRWFYTCQKPQHKRCPFFLWVDEAKVREEAAVLSNSKNEPMSPDSTRTPRQLDAKATPLTPQSKSETRNDEMKTRRSKDNDSQATISHEGEDSYGWHSSGDEGLAQLAQDDNDAAFETPRKSIKTSNMTSPSKRPRNELSNTDLKQGSAQPINDDVFHTPSTISHPIGLLSPITTTSRQLQAAPPISFAPSLTKEVLEILKPANLSSVIEEQLCQVLSRHELRAHGIARGRDITRVAVQTKDRTIAELQARISALEAERETTRTVIAHLKQDIATSPRRPRRPQ